MKTLFRISMALSKLIPASVIIGLLVCVCFITKPVQAVIVEVPANSGLLYDVYMPPGSLVPVITPLFMPGEYPAADQKTLIDVFHTALNLAKTDNVFHIGNGMKCGIAADNMVDTLASILPSGWAATRYDSVDILNLLGSTGHTITVLTSPSGASYIVDGYSGLVDIAAAYKVPGTDHYRLYPDQLHNLTLLFAAAAVGNLTGEFQPGANTHPEYWNCRPDPPDILDSEHITASTSIDPNIKINPTGYGTAQYVSGTQKLTFIIHFENLATAGFPAQRVVVKDVLDDSLDLSSLELNTIAFNNVTLSIPWGLSHYATTTQVATDPNPVKVSATLDVATRTLTWVIQSVDAFTGNLPENPLAGFLPPNAPPPQGEGYVSFSAIPASGLAFGTTIHNTASITFDYNKPISTVQVVNTLDTQPPAGSVAALPPKSPRNFDLHLGGSDSGSGIALYDIYVSDNGGDFILMTKGITATVLSFPGVIGHTYRFYCLATDHVGNRQLVPQATYAETKVAYFIFLPNFLKR